jgi:MFS family permease
VANRCSGWYFKDYFNQPSRATIGTVVAVLEIGAFISSLLVGRVGDMIGRRRTILYGSIVFFIGGAFQTFATGIPMMMIGRIIAGLGVGALSTIVPVYQSEISVCEPLSSSILKALGYLLVPSRSHSLRRYADEFQASSQPWETRMHRIHRQYCWVCD